ncbi:patatin-like protein 2 [Senna tora]|uniref:Patatin n=1 Tax=Senna tora TaxID=362788 RepID=A0A835CLY8_9FABA|nr:patatin-like protein 2 [Senna tora]
MKTNSSLDAKLSDICIGTSAAPTYLPPYYFKNKADNGIDKEFNLIDGGIFANNPVSYIYIYIYKPNDYTKIFLVSLGTGFQKPNEEYDARKAAHWGALNWISPSMEFALDGSQDLVDYHLASVFHSQLGHNYHRNYLRIQTDQLAGRMAQMDCALEDNLKNLENLAQSMLKHNVTRLNLDTFKLQSILGGPTNAEALTR